MPILLEGGCAVAGLREGQPRRHHSVQTWRHFHRGTGTRAISLQVLEFGQGLARIPANASSEQVFYVLEGEAAAYLDGWREQLAPGTGIYLRPGISLTVENPGTQPITFLGAQCPDSAVEQVIEASSQPKTSGSTPWPRPVVRLSDGPPVPTGDRWYRVLVDRTVGCEQVTQFVGGIPPGRAPDHFHHYEEVLCILSGVGRLWSGNSSTPIAAGSCIFLPRGQPHCLENTGTAELTLLGVFYPAGSPAARYAADQDPTTA
jgi:mannose-6-phosphate isomerase-like protein (cupin superfamily)